MIKTLQQAREVQIRRVSAGRFGYAKAVRRYLMREHKQQYQIIKKNLSVVFPKKGAKKIAA